MIERPARTGAIDYTGAGMGDDGLLERIHADDRAEFEARAVRRTFRANTVLFHEGDPSDFVLGIYVGRVKISVVTDEGREVLLNICDPGELLGDLAAVDGLPRSATATTMEAVEAGMLQAGDFTRFLEDRPAVAVELIRTVTSRLRASDRRGIEYAALDSIGRVASRIVALADRYGTHTDDGIVVELAITQAELAGWAGCSVEATTKALHALRKADIVATARRKLTILDLDRLRDRATPF